ncbi:hypothetical protein COX85_04075 [Candidatus Micrarchaeota archaeon CG_4_10_14_0_2_um_filter_55_9]|nr:MAG: hypothetical protein COX85_04075 [Candidatus Micrarchaeota archaeon CG_4_10_14_0_2_um_filter_55_9]
MAKEKLFEAAEKLGKMRGPSRDINNPRKPLVKRLNGLEELSGIAFSRRERPELQKKAAESLLALYRARPRSLQEEKLRSAAIKALSRLNLAHVNEDVIGVLSNGLHSPETLPHPALAEALRGIAENPKQRVEFRRRAVQALRENAGNPYAKKHLQWLVAGKVIDREGSLL